MVSLYYVIQKMHSFSMRPAKYFYDKPLPKYLDPKTVLIYRPHPVEYLSSGLNFKLTHFITWIRI
jgi:hypothetical protein